MIDRPDFDVGDLVVCVDDGPHRVHGDLPDLIPPAPAAEPQPDGVWVTREMFEMAFHTAVKARLSVPDNGQTILPYLMDALGVPPAKPKLAPWEEAYEAWWCDKSPDHPDSDDIWQAAWEACERHHGIKGDAA